MREGANPLIFASSPILITHPENAIDPELTLKLESSVSQANQYCLGPAYVILLSLRGR